MTSANDQVHSDVLETAMDNSQEKKSVERTQSWSKEHVRSLRLSLGWCQSEIARRLSCSVAEVSLFESGQSAVSPSVASALFLLEKCADACRDEVQASPLAEKACEKRALGQIDFADVKEDIQ